MTLYQYVVENREREIISDPFDTYPEALAYAKTEDGAVICLEYEYSDSRLVDERYDLWPPEGSAA